ncbi:hypothetical protein MATL_G00057920 [Megalops atlanticus]|uniref:C-type lectin domain-containing protein n=1 Tax=Megalops atlanticus TaxID=7932 RepID=A0A9D3TFN8_MEGAT|nr:hypothetical protein MATL_G00057920 [Megalops atlanticus]
MDSNGYDQFHGPDQLSSYHGQKVIIYRGRRITVAYVLYGIVLLLLLILLLITGVKFSQLSQEVADIKLFIVSVNASLAGSLAKLSKTDPVTIPLPYHSEHHTLERGPCDEDWVFFQGSCYQLSTKRANWHNAQQNCDQMGAHLIVINNAEEQEFITDLLSVNSYWIGLIEREEGHWTWVDGTDFATTPQFWHVGQPDDWDVVVNGEDCGQIQYDPDPRWNDADCTLRHLYICEQEEK